uniref:uncharacterized protein LOC122599696 isoform X2 n=1 Tax=Erigeron canadensis TaxID=72917 RepID=UPI001CB94399|nr:uncharacterized protein LOC122599696 isoform X2 [Erigeron canadensis]
MKNNMENQDSKEYFSATVTLKNNVRVFKNIKEKLTPGQRKLFETTCFGPWLQVQHPNGDPLLCHLILQSMIDDVPPEGLAWHPSDMWFHFPPAYTRFGREEFCLVTGLRFGRHDTFSSYTKHITKALWPEKVFTDLGNVKKVKIMDLKRSFDKLDFKKMNDIDVVRLCLLYAVDVGFLGRQDSQPISKDLLLLAENLDAWNLFPWGSYIWEFTRKQLSTAIVKRPHVHQNGVKYTLSRFVWAFKIWILEAFPSMRSFTMKMSSKDIPDIPRAIAWKRKKQLNWTELVTHASINDKEDIPVQTLTPTEAEAATEWWQASKRFFDGTDDQDLSVFEDRDGGPDDSSPWHREKSPYQDNSPRDQSPQKSDFPYRKKQRIHMSPRSPPLRDESATSGPLINTLLDEVWELREIVSLVSPLQKEVRLLEDKVSSLQEEVRVLQAEASRFFA